jgi:hypothetical protein
VAQLMGYGVGNFAAAPVCKDKAKLTPAWQQSCQSFPSLCPKRGARKNL